MKFIQVNSLDGIAHYLNDIIKGCKAVAHKNPGLSVEHTLNMISWNIERYNCFFLVADHRDRCVGFLFAMGVKNSDISWCEIISLWTVPRLAHKIKFEAIDLLKKWCKDLELPSIVTNITRGLTPHSRAKDGAYLEWFLKDLGFEEVGKVIRMKV